MVEAKIIKEKILRDGLKRITEENFGTMVKVVIDIRRKILALGGEWHSEGDDLLVRDGSSRIDIWGANFYPWNAPNERIEYIALINIKPFCGNLTMEVEDKKIREKIHNIVQELLLRDDETIDVPS